MRKGVCVLGVCMRACVRACVCACVCACLPVWSCHKKRRKKQEREETDKFEKRINKGKIKNEKELENVQGRQG